MALTPDEAARLQKMLVEIEKLSKQLNKNINTINLQPLEDNAGTIESLFESLNDEVKDLNAGASYLLKNFHELTGEINNNSTGLKQVNKGLKGLSSIAEQLVNYQRGYSDLSSKDIQILKDKSEIERKRLQDASKLLTEEIDTQKAKQAGLSQASDEYQKIQTKVDKLSSTQSNINQLLDKENISLKGLNDELDKEKTNLEKIEKAMGLGGAALNGIQGALNKMGMSGLSSRLGLDEANKKMKALSDEIIDNNENVDKFSTKFKVLGTGLKSVGSSLISNLKDPLVVVGFLATQFVETLLSVDKQTGELAKGFNLSYKEASNLRDQLNNVANASGDINVNTKGLQESLMAVGQSLGTNAKLNSADLVTMTKLREQAGLSNDELVAMQKLTLATGGNLESNTKSLMASAGSVAAANGVMLNQKTIMQEISKTSAATKLSLAGNPAALGAAAAQAKALGMNLDQVNKIADQMLNIESSISSELEAELLTGKNLNLEQARLFALNNDMEGLSKEIAKNFGSAAEFSKMNRIQQEAAAKAVGMSREELAGSLVEQESLGKISKEAFANRVKEVGLDKAQKELKDGQFDKMMQQQSLQEKIVASVEKLKDLFVTLIQPLMPVLDTLSSILDLAGLIVKPFQMLSDLFGKIGEGISSILGPLGMVGKILKGLAGIAVVYAAYSAFASLATIPVVGAVLGAAAAAAITAAGFGLLSKVKTADDMVSPGYGKRTLHGPEGAIALNDKDTVIAGTNLFDKKGDDTISEPGKATKTENIDTIKVAKNEAIPTTSGGSNAASIDLSPLINEMAAVKAVLSQILAKEGAVYLDSTKVGTSLNVGTSKIQ